MADRIESLDTLKGLSLLFVVYIHANLLFIDTSGLGYVIEFAVANTSRIAVPLFFLISGYLYSKKLDERNEFSYTKSYLKKLAYYYLIGSVVYFFMQIGYMGLNQFFDLNIVSQTVELNIWGLEGLSQFLYFGKAVAFHLWFLTALFYSILLIYVFNEKDRIRELFFASVFLHFIGILSNAYGLLQFIPVPETDMLFFGLFMTTAGFVAERKNLAKRSERFYLALSVLFGFIHLMERVVINWIRDVSPYFWSDYSLFTAPLTISLLLYGLTNQELGKNSVFNRYGRYTIWGYIMHVIALGIFVGLTVIIQNTLGISMTNSNIWVFSITLISYFAMMETILYFKK